MIVIQRLAFDSGLGMVHPDLTYGRQLQQTKLYHGFIVTYETRARSTEVHLPAGVLYFALFVSHCLQLSEGVVFWINILWQVVTSHIVVAVITVD